MRRWRGGGVVPVLALTVLAAAYLVSVARHTAPDGLPHFDTYAVFVPNARYAAESLRAGHGLLWNRFQNCGQPFLAVSPTALLYPPHALELVLDVHTTLRVLFFLHLVLAGVGMYALCRTLRVSRAAALCGAVAFELGANTVWTAYWSPVILATYAWMPAALALAERTLERPTTGRTLALAAALALQLVAGYPQVSLFTYQLIALRVAWEAATRWRASLPRAAAALVAAAVLAPLLGAVQFVPSLEVAAQSIRNRALTLAELRPPHVTLTWAQFREHLGQRYAYGALFTFAALVVASLAWVRRAPRRVVLFYVLAGVVHFALAFDTPLYALYRRLPFGSTFREPHRFIWVTAVVGCVAVAAGADAVIRGGERGRRRGAMLVAPVLVALGFAALSPTGVRPAELAVAGAIVAALVTPATPRTRSFVALALPAVLATDLLVRNWVQIFNYLPDDAVLMQHRPAFEAVRERLTLQDRMYPVAGERSASWQGLFDGLIKKSGQLFRLPSIVDYELQTSDRYAQILVRLFMDAPMTSLNQFVFLDLAPVPASRPLFDLLAARWIVIDAPRAAALGWPAGPDFTLAWEHDGQRVYQNRRALPRAFFVPQARVAGDAAAVLEALATGRDDPRRVALLEGAPPVVLGTAEAAGHAEIEADRSEALTVRVEASAPGFLFVSDQDYPGWTATVDGRPTPIRRANLAFRLVDVPAGTSRVEFRYRPRSLVGGAAISALTFVAVGLLAWRARRPRRR